MYGTSGSPNNDSCAGSGSVTNQPCFYKTKILRYTYNTTTHSLGSPTIVIDNLMGSNDHNSGRLKISPVPESDGSIISIIRSVTRVPGQFNNGFRTNNAQNKDIYEGKVLRLNTEDDGDLDDGAYSPWIPNDNPFHKFRFRKCKCCLFVRTPECAGSGLGACGRTIYFIQFRTW